MFYEPRQGHGLPRDPFKALVVPRPIGWISTVDGDGRINLAPFSYFNAVADGPPQVFFAANGRKSDAPIKDSRANAEATGCFVVNLATWALRDAMNLTSAKLPVGEDEMKAAGLTAAPSRVVTAPRVAESPVNLECRYLQTVQLAGNDPAEPNAMVIGEVVGVHIDDGFLVDGRVDTAKLRPIARLGYAQYAVVDTVFELRRPE
jgi:flavin reductase (DIM6/NTAB) family NADH-FMN oxidoreductase RutF